MENGPPGDCCRPLRQTRGASGGPIIAASRDARGCHLKKVLAPETSLWPSRSRKVRSTERSYEMTRTVLMTAAAICLAATGAFAKAHDQGQTDVPGMSVGTETVGPAQSLGGKRKGVAGLSPPFLRLSHSALRTCREQARMKSCRRSPTWSAMATPCASRLD